MGHGILSRIRSGERSEQEQHYRQLVLVQASSHRILYRNFKYVIFPSKAISTFPPFFVNLLERDSEDFMLTEEIIKS